MLQQRGAYMPLNDMLCRTSKPKDKPYKLSDEYGLYLEVMPSGAKYWRLKYRIFNKEKRLAFGVYPEISLAEARAKRGVARDDLRSGNDPAIMKLQRKQTEAFSHTQTFELLAREWHSQNKPAWNPRYAKTVLHRLEKYLFPEIGLYPIALLTSDIILACLRKIDGRAPDMARRVKQLCSNVFIYAKNIRRVPADITTGLEQGLRKYKKGHFASISVDELPEFLVALHDFKCRMHRQTYLAIQLMLLTFIRTNELIKGVWTEIDFENAKWVIPGQRMKMGKDHIVPLSKQAISILNELKEMNSKREYIFTHSSQPRKHMSNGTILQVLKRLKFPTDMTGHGFRSLALGILKEKLKYTHEIADRQLAHVKKNTTDRAYDRAEHLEERTKMMQDYANHLDDTFLQQIKDTIYSRRN